MLPAATQQASSSIDMFVSGRLCLFGEHSDWAGGHRGQNMDLLPGKTIVIGTQEGYHAKVHALEQPVLHLSSVSITGEQLPDIHLPLDHDKLLQVAQAGGFDSYVAGVAYRVLLSHKVGGLSIDIHCSTLPISKGLSSSAAICVLVARAFNQVYDLKLTIRGEMELAYLGETTTPSKCGRMDQACAHGPGSCVEMTFDSDLLDVQPAALGAPLHLVLVDLCAAKNTTTILRNLQAAYPVAKRPEHVQLHDLLGPINHSLVRRALGAMVSGDLPLLGALMVEAQKEFDARAAPVCPCQLAAPVLHGLLSHPVLQPLIWGGKGVGSQGDGTGQLLCKGVEEQKAVCDIVTHQLGFHATPLTVGGSEFGQSASFQS